MAQPIHPERLGNAEKWNSAQTIDSTCFSQETRTRSFHKDRLQDSLGRNRRLDTIWGVKVEFV